MAEDSEHDLDHDGGTPPASYSQQTHNTQESVAAEGEGGDDVSARTHPVFELHTDKCGVFKLWPGKNTVGSAPDNDIVLDRPEVSGEAAFVCVCVCVVEGCLVVHARKAVIFYLRRFLL